MKARLATAGGLAACLASTLLFAATAQAQGAPAGWRGLYIGGGGNYSNVSVDVDSGCYDYDECWWGDYYDYDTGDGDYGYNVHVGLRINDYVALEAGYVDTGTIRWEEDLVYFPDDDLRDYYNNRVDFSAQITEVSLLGILPASEWFEVYLRLGAGFWDAESEQHLEQSFGLDERTRRVTDSGTGMLGGVGFGVTFADALHVRLEYQATTIDEDMLNARDDSSVESILLELQFRFGAGQSSIQPSGPPTATP
jgi:opacity protein-like surface antigen